MELLLTSKEMFEKTMIKESGCFQKDIHIRLAQAYPFGIWKHTF